MLTNLGLPTVNELAIGDRDLETLEERCPFNWDTMEWKIAEEYPDCLNLGLQRS